MVVAMVSPAAASSHADGAPGQAKGHDKEAAAVTTTTVVDTGNGANQDCGAYCPNGVGLPSGNGNGNGEATGKPCAGCVGNADDKNPPGQYKDGSDHNNGYECDGNHGIGRTNPAHTGCDTTTTAPAPTTTTTEVPCTGADCTTTTTAPSTTTTTAPSETTTTVAPEATTTTLRTNVLGESFTRPPTSASPALAFTGGPFARLFWAGVALVLLGLVIVAHRRRGAWTE
jgi:hypothetical protein